MLSRCPLLLLTSLLLPGCSLFGSEERHTPAVSGSRVASPVARETVPVIWVEDALPPVHGLQQERPFRDVVVEGEDFWRLYVVEGGGDPEIITESRRLLSSPVWADDGVSLLIATASRLEGRVPNSFLNGYAKYARGDAHPIWDEAFEPSVSAKPAPNARLLLVTDRRGLGGRASAVYLKEPLGKSWRLEGLPGDSIRGDAWSPDGAYSVISVRHEHELGLPARSFYVVQPSGDHALFVGVQDYGITPRWSPDGGRLAFASGHDLVVLDIASGHRQTVPIGLYIAAAPRWNETGALIAFENGVIDAVSGRVLIQPGETHVTDSAISPDGRWFAFSLEPRPPVGASCVLPPLANVTLLRDLDGPAHQARPLLSCEDGFYTYVNWVASDRLMVRGPSCWGCESYTSRLALVSVPEGGVQPLTEGLEPAASYAVSPEDGRLLVGGSKLRVYAANGSPLRVIEAPRGFAVTAVAWSPDGSRFAYVVGPARLDIL